MDILIHAIWFVLGAIAGGMGVSAMILAADVDRKQARAAVDEQLGLFEEVD